MLAHAREPSALFSWNPIFKWSRIRQWTTWFALPLISVFFSSSAVVGCGGSGGCSSGSASSGAGSQYNADPMANHAGSSMRGSSMRGSSMQHQHKPMESPMAPMGTSQTGRHGGQLLTLKKHQVEVVFTPKETRVYLYSATGEPLAVRGVQGDVAMKIRGIQKIYRYTFREASDASDQSFLLVQVDASRLRDGDMEATFQLAGLPFQDESKAHFVQTFALAQPAAVAPSTLEVRQVAKTHEDLALIARQKICPVTGESLESMGGAIKLMVGDQPLFVCCEGCVDQVKDDPTTYLAKLNR